MSVYLTKEFARFARKAGLAGIKLHQAATDVMAGRYDADLGGGVFKQRVAREGGGKSGGFRTIILFRIGSHVFSRTALPRATRPTFRPRNLRR